MSIQNQACSGEPEAGGSACSGAHGFDTTRADFLPFNGRGENEQQRHDDAFAAAKRRTSMLRLDWASWEKTSCCGSDRRLRHYAQTQAFSTLADSMNEAIQAVSADCVKTLTRDLRAADIPWFRPFAANETGGGNAPRCITAMARDSQTYLPIPYRDRRGQRIQEHNGALAGPDFDKISSCGPASNMWKRSLRCIISTRSSGRRIGRSLGLNVFQRNIWLPHPSGADGTIKNGGTSALAPDSAAWERISVCRKTLSCPYDCFVLQIGYLRFRHYCDHPRSIC